MMQQLSRARVHYLAKSISNNTLLLNRIPKHFPSSYRYASSSSDDNLRKTIDEMKQRQNKNSENPGDASTNNKSDSSEPTNMNLSGWKEWTVQSYEKLVYNVRVAYDEMVGENQESILTKKVHQAESFRKEKKKEEADEEDEQPTVETVDANAPSALVVMKEPKGAWEQMKERLQDSPFIREILKKSKVVGSAAASTDLGKTAQNVGQSVKDKVGDLREFWETSQNPIIYTLSGVWDNMTGETEEGIALTEIKKLDPKFSKEEWATEIKRNLAPKIIKAHLEGDLKFLKKWLGEAVFNKLAADIRMRKSDGITFDPTILDIDENQLIMRYIEGGGPIIVGVYMVQQINCIKNRKGEIVEGGESDIRAKFYSIAFQQYFDDDSQLVSWKIVDYEFAGDMPYY